MSRAAAPALGLAVLIAAAPATAERPRLHSPALGEAAAKGALSPAVRKAVAGRTAGESIDCIDQDRARSARVLDRTAILWELSPRRWVVNFPPRGCATLRGDRTVVTRSGGYRLCQGEMIRVLTNSGITAGLCKLGRFVPYSR